MSPTVTPADHDAGFKEIEVVFRNGARKTIKIFAPPYRKAQKLALQLQQTKDPLCITAACLDGIEATTETYMNTLTIESASLVEMTAFALTFGDEFQKKMEAMGEKLEQSMASTESAPKFALSVPGLARAKSVNILCPNCSCTIVLSGSTGSNKTSAASGPAQPVA